jgi:hypothetical protein
MAEIKLSSGSVPAGTPYPGNFGDFLTTLSSYLSVEYPEELRYAVVSSATPTGSNQDKLWFKIAPQTGIPSTVNLFVNGSWLEFTQFNFGDMVLVDSAANIVSPWGEGSATYTVAGQQLLTPQTPNPPAGFKYKVYVGNYL